MSDIKQIKVNDEIYDINLKASKDVEVKTLKTGTAVTEVLKVGTETEKNYSTLTVGSDSELVVSGGVKAKTLTAETGIMLAGTIINDWSEVGGDSLELVEQNKVVGTETPVDILTTVFKNDSTLKPDEHPVEHNVIVENNLTVKGAIKLTTGTTSDVPNVKISTDIIIGTVNRTIINDKAVSTEELMVSKIRLGTVEKTTWPSGLDNVTQTAAPGSYKTEFSIAGTTPHNVKVSGNLEVIGTQSTMSDLYVSDTLIAQHIVGTDLSIDSITLNNVAKTSWPNELEHVQQHTSGTEYVTYFSNTGTLSHTIEANKTKAVSIVGSELNVDGGITLNGARITAWPSGALIGVSQEDSSNVLFTNFENPSIGKTHNVAIEGSFSVGDLTSVKDITIRGLSVIEVDSSTIPVEDPAVIAVTDTDSGSDLLLVNIGTEYESDPRVIVNMPYGDILCGSIVASNGIRTINFEIETTVTNKNSVHSDSDIGISVLKRSSSTRWSNFDITGNTISGKSLNNSSGTEYFKLELPEEDLSGNTRASLTLVGSLIVDGIVGMNSSQQVVTPDIYYSNLNKTSGVGITVEAALDDLYTRIVALETANQ